MCSRNILGVSLLIFLTASSCTLLANHNPEAPTADIDTSGGCLSATGDVIERFSQGRLDAAEHGAFFDCLDKAVLTFSESTEGANPDYFIPEEISGFLSKYFLNGKPIQIPLINAGLALKVGLIGGRPDRLGKDDLRNLGKVFLLLRGLSGTLRTLMPISAEHGNKLSPEQFANMMRTFISSTTDFGEQMKGLQGDFHFESLGNLMRELQKFIFPGSSAPEDHWTNNVILYSKILPPAKAILVSPPRDIVLSSDWYNIYRQGPRYFGALLRARYYMQSPFALLNGSGLITFEGLFDDFVHSFAYLLDQQPSKMISSEEIDDLVNTFDENGVLPCTPATARQAVRMVFGKLLGNGDPNRFAITKDSLNNFSENMRFMFEGLRATEALYRTKFGNSFLTGSLSREEIESVASTELLKSTLLGNALSMEAVEAVKSTPRGVKAVFSYGDFGVTIPKDGVNRSFPYDHVSKTQLLRALDRLLIHGYGDPRTNKISEAQLNAFTDDLFPILIETGLVDETLKPSIAKRLSEASMFLPSSDGDKGLTMNEAIEFEAILLSTIENGKKVHALVAAACPDNGTDAKGNPLILSACYSGKFAELYSTILSQVPGLQEYMAKQTTAQRQAIFQLIMGIARSGQSITDYVTIEDSKSIVMISYYVEMIYTRFDGNRDGLLVNAEGDRAFPIFRPFIADKASAQGHKNPKDHEAIFNFILAYRKLPNDDVWDYIVRRYLLGPKKYSVERAQMVEIFAMLMKM